MAAQRIPSSITPEQYLEWEQEEGTKNEYYDGIIVAMSGGSLNHDRVTFNLTIQVGTRLADECKGNTADMRIGVRAYNRYFYPDLSVTCGERQVEKVKNAQSLLNPTLIFEALSPSTERVDRGDKLRCCRVLDSLAAYVIVSQDTPRVEIYTRQTDGAWRYEDVSGLDAVLSLPAINAQLGLADIYADVVFAADPDLVSDTDAQAGAEPDTP